MSGEDERDQRPSKSPEASIEVPPPPLGPADSGEGDQAVLEEDDFDIPALGEPGESIGDADLAADVDAAFDAAFVPAIESVAPDSMPAPAVDPEPPAPVEAEFTVEAPFAQAATVLASMPPADADTTALDREPPTVEPPHASLSMEIEPASAIDTIDLEAPDLDEDDQPELSSLVGEIPWQEERRGQLVVVAGGKGGAGRSLLAANLGLFLSRLGREVVLADLDPAGASLHTFLGLEPLIPSTGAAYRGFPPPRIDKLQGSTRLCRPGRPLFGGPDDPARVEVLEAARELAEDLLIVDIGTQVDALSLDLFVDADVAMVVTLPERPAIERTYGFLRQALDRRLLGADDHPARMARTLVAGDDQSKVDAPPDLVAALTGIEPQAAEAIRARLIGFAPGIVLNRCRTRAERDMATGMCTALRRRWHINAELLACVDNDDAVFEAARRRRPLVLEYPGSTVSGQIEKLARRILSKVGVRG
jgi:flagellar biosynthesis protein FlhG